MSASLPPSDQTLVHFYRAVVAHADVWRQRMDATTNWAVATTAVMITFTFNSADSPHFVLLIALAFDAMFLIMESRRYQAYDLWRRRFRSLNQHMIAPILLNREDASLDAIRQEFSRLAIDLGRTVPHLTLADAVGYRIRRNYGYLFTIGVVAWLLKLHIHPVAARGAAEFVGRAGVGAAPGAVVLAVVGALMLAATVLALRAPSELMLDWADIPPPMKRWLRRRDRPA